MTYDEYASIDAVNWSTLKNMRDSALAYKHRLNAPREDTPSLALGRVTHALVFEPDTFARDFAIYEGGDRRGQGWKDYQEANAGKTIFKPSEVDAAVAMADAVRRHPLVQPYLDGGVFEQLVEWTDPPTGLRCKAKTDWTIESRGVLADLKTCRSIDGRRFGAAAATYGYHSQLAHYRNGIRCAQNWQPDKVIIIAVESAAPHDVAVFQLDVEALYAGDEEVRGLLAKLAAHRASNEWPGRYSEEQALQLPAWLFMDDDDENPDGFNLNVGGR